MNEWMKMISLSIKIHCQGELVWEQHTQLSLKVHNVLTSLNFEKEFFQDGAICDDFLDIRVCYKRPFYRKRNKFPSLLIESRGTAKKKFD